MDSEDEPQPSHLTRRHLFSLGGTLGAGALMVGCTADGSDDDLHSADLRSGGQPVHLDAGRHIIHNDLTVSSPVSLGPGSHLAPDPGVTVTLNNLVQAPPWQQVFDGEGAVHLGVPQTVHADWWGPKSSSRTIQRAIDSTAPGTRIELAGTYVTTGISLRADAGTQDEGKALIGIASPGVRRRSADEQWGAEIQLAPDAAADLITANGASKGRDHSSRFAFSLDNIKLTGRSSHSKPYVGISFNQVKDFYIGRILIENCSGHGIDVTGSSNQIIGQHIEVMTCGDVGINLVGLGDSHFDLLIVGGNGSDGLVLGGGTQVNQVHAYLNSRAGVSLKGRQNQIGYIRSNDNGHDGVGLDGAVDSQLTSLILADNGTDTSASPAVRSGLRIDGDTSRIQITQVNASSSKGTQVFGIRFNAGMSGTNNVVMSYVGSGNSESEVSFGSGISPQNYVVLLNGDSGTNASANADGPG